jgi:hypothetical protein
MKRLTEGSGGRNGFAAKCFAMNSIAELPCWTERFEHPAESSEFQRHLEQRRIIAGGSVPFGKSMGGMRWLVSSSNLMLRCYSCKLAPVWGG